MNTGIMVGFVVSSHIAYHVIPCAVVGLPVLYVLLATRYPEPPQQLIRWKREEEAEKSLRYYRRCDGPNVSKEEERAYQKHFDEMRLAIQQQNNDTDDNGLSMSDFRKRFSEKHSNAYLDPHPCSHQALLESPGHGISFDGSQHLHGHLRLQQLHVQHL